MNKNLNLLIDALRNEGMRYTKQRKIVWDEICRSSEHRDAEEIYLKINKNRRNVSRATVYRTIDVLVKNNLVRQLELGDGRKRFENKLDSKHHDHIVCLSCGNIQEFVHTYHQNILPYLCLFVVVISWVLLLVCGT